MNALKSSVALPAEPDTPPPAQARARRVRARPLRAAGLTAVELMVTMAIVAILAAIAIPSYLSTIQANRTTGEANALISDLQFARAEAIRRGVPVQVCISSDGSTCLGSGTNWHNGWIVWVPSAAAGSQRIKDRRWTSTDTLVADNSINAIPFSRDGFALGLPGTVTLTLHTAPVRAAASRCVEVNLVGRQRVIAPGTGSCT